MSLKLSGRKSPIALAAAGRKAPRDVMWAAIRELHRFTVPDLAWRADIALGSARKFVDGLVAAGLVGPIPAAPRGKGRGGQALHFELVKDIGPITPRVGPDGAVITAGTARAAAWRAMKSLKTFTLRDLHVIAAISEGDAQKYCGYLVKAGYLAYRVKGAGGKPSTFRFIERRFTGPLPPQLARMDVVYDPNLRQVVWPLADQVDEVDE